MAERINNGTDYLKVKTRGGSNPSGKRKVYFTCHPKDFDLYFDKVCDDIFKTQDCAIYYTADMTAPLPEQYLESDLGQMSLFVMPVTFRLLTENSRAMDFDFAFATSEKHLIPVLPIVMETNTDENIKSFFDEKYKARFGERQYLCPYMRDITAISYEEKLKKYLSSILLDDDTVERVRKAFDAYIFLSYRKKDRNHANELMGLIHKNPLYRDVAIWYDEFLTPGESFEENIKKALDKSELFALLVTPNLINEENYVQTTEYPYAHNKAKKVVLPAEMVKTDREELKKQYPGIPDCVNAHTDELDSGIIDGLRSISLRANEDNPEHCYLIGLAYLDGIDVEVNKEYALELITAAAELEYPEAMEKLFFMFHDGDKIQVDYNKALHWAQKLYNYYLKLEGEMGEDVLVWLNNLANAYGYLGNYQKALKLQEKCYKLRCEVFGCEHCSTLTSLTNLAAMYSYLGEYQKACELQEKCCEIKCKTLDCEDLEMVLLLSNLAVIYNNLGKYQKEFELHEKCYKIRCKNLGEEHPDTLKSLNGLACSYKNLGYYQKAFELQKKCYEISCRVLGKEHIDTILSMNNLAHAYCVLGCYKDAFRLQDIGYIISCRVLGEKHIYTLALLRGLVVSCAVLGNYEKSQKLQKKCYRISCKVLGKEHPYTLCSMENFAYVYTNLGNYKKALKVHKKCYKLYCKVLGKEHPDTLIVLNNLGDAYSNIKKYQKALELNEKCYELRRKILGEEHPATIMSINDLAQVFKNLKEYQKALELQRKCYEMSYKVLGDENAKTIDIMNNLAVIYIDLGDNQKALELQKRCYEVSRNIFGEYSYRVITSLYNLAIIYKKIGDYEKSLEFKKAYKSHKRIYEFDCFLIT